MTYEYDKDEIKNSLTIEQMFDYLAELGGEPQLQGEIIICRTICHGGNKRRLYYYENTKLLKCFTDCADTFDVFELTLKVKSRETPKIRTTKEGKTYEDSWNLPEAIDFVARYFGFAPKQKEEFDVASKTLEDWKILNNYDRIENIDNKTQIVELKIYDDNILKNLPRPRIEPWIEEGISQEVLNRNGICYDPKNCGIVIPHYDQESRLIGIRERTLVKEEEVKGKYRPAYLNKQLYNHPLSFSLYNFNNSKNNIAKLKKAFVFEGEKSCLKYASYFGPNNDISVACCGSSLIQYQVKLLIAAGAEEIIVGFDKQFQVLNDEEHRKLVKNFYNIKKKYGAFIKLSFLFDRENILGYKASPIDEGKEKFLELFKKRVVL